MLTHFIDIKAIPQAEMLQTTVVAHIWQVLHRHLPSINQANDPVAIAFPAYGQGGTLGGIIRLLGSLDALDHLITQIEALRSYALISEPKPVPAKPKGYARFVRKHYKGASHVRQLKKRAAERGETWSQEHEEAVVKKYKSKRRLPFVLLKSSSTAQANMRLHVDVQPAAAFIQGKFTGYGLSDTNTEAVASVPVF